MKRLLTASKLAGFILIAFAGCVFFVFVLGRMPDAIMTNADAYLKAITFKFELAKQFVMYLVGIGGGLIGFKTYMQGKGASNAD